MSAQTNRVPYEILFSFLTTFFAGISLLRLAFRLSGFEAEVWGFELVFSFFDWAIWDGIRGLFQTLGVEVSQLASEFVFLYILCIGFMSRSIGYSKRLHLVAPERQLEEPEPRPSQIKERVYGRKPVTFLRQLFLSVVWPFTLILSFTAKHPNSRFVTSLFRDSFVSEIIQAVFAGFAWAMLYFLLMGLGNLIAYLLI